MKKRWFLVVTVIVVVSGLFVANLCLADDDDDEITSGSIRIAGESLPDLTYKASVSLVEAVEIAQNEVEGKAWFAAIENENGFLVYDIEIITAERNVVDFIIDAGTGEILEIDAHFGTDDDDDNGDHDNGDNDDD
jgi:uncharacterized membrane protein YkoI